MAKCGYTVEASKAHPESPMTVPSLCEVSSADSSFLDDSVSLNISIESFDDSVPKKLSQNDRTICNRSSVSQEKKEETGQSSHTRNNSLYSIGDLPPLSIPARSKSCAEVPKERTNPQKTIESKDATMKHGHACVYPLKGTKATDKKSAPSRNQMEPTNQTENGSQLLVGKTQEKQKSENERSPYTEARTLETEQYCTNPMEHSLLIPILDVQKTHKSSKSSDGCRTNMGGLATELIKKLKELEKEENQTNNQNRNNESTIYLDRYQSTMKSNPTVRGRAQQVSRCTNSSSLEVRLQQSIEREIQQTNEVDKLLEEIKHNRITLEEEVQAKKMLQAKVGCLEQLSSSQQETISSQQKAIERYEKQIRLLRTNMSTKANDEYSSGEMEARKCDETHITKKKTDEVERLNEVESNESLMQKHLDNMKEESHLFAEQLIQSEDIINKLKEFLEEKEEENGLLRTELLRTKEKLNVLETRSNSLLVLQGNISKLETITNQNASSDSTNESTKKEKNEIESQLRNRIHELEIKITRMTKVSVAQELQLSGKSSEIEKLKISHISEVTMLDQDKEVLTNRLAEKDKELAKLKDRLRSYNESSSSFGSGGINERSLPREWSGNINVGGKDEWKRAVSESVNASVNFLNGLSVAANMAKCAQPL